MLPFTRMFLGPMDYTPGAMVNASKKSFAIDFSFLPAGGFQMEAWQDG